VNFTGSGSDSDGQVSSYQWDFDGDDTFDFTSDTTGNTSYEYTSSSNFVAEFRVTDNLGLSNRMLFKIGVVESGQAVDVGGQITTDQTWPTGFSFHAEDNIVIPSGITLTIEPDVTIKFSSGLSMQVDGTLVARGTESLPIIFSSVAPTPTAGDWGFIKFSDSSIDAVFDGDGNYLSGSVIQYCQVSYAGYGEQSYSAAIQVETSAPFIDHCQISHNKGGGIYTQTPASIRISNSTINHSNRFGNSYDQNGGGIIVYGGSATINNNILTNNQAYQRAGAITVFSNDAPTLIIGNTITDNEATGNGSGAGGIHISANQATVTIKDNVIRDNNGSAGYGGGAGGIKVTSNNAEVVIDDNTIKGNAGSSGIDLGGHGFGPTGSATITNNQISENSPHGIVAVGSSTTATAIRGNQIYNNTVNGIRVESANSDKPTVVENNTVYANAGGIVFARQGYTQYDNATVYASVSGNVIRDNTEFGLYVTSGGGSISGNSFSGNSGTRTIFVKNDRWSLNNNNISGNTSTS
ncbi:TPA: right-handed parallel beta-helix repeat-containing protein, partial [Candidatus Poribacteria bacterium]|nr:right-handed parallel beta-helix repeat-containing protein [Candidatus Poribacteria bacterium]